MCVCKFLHIFMMFYGINLSCLVNRACPHVSNFSFFLISSGKLASSPLRTARLSWTCLIISFSKILHSSLIDYCQPARFLANSSQLHILIPKSFRLLFIQCLYFFLGLCGGRFPILNSSWKSCFWSLVSSICTTCIWLVMIYASILRQPAFWSTTVSGVKESQEAFLIECLKPLEMSCPHFWWIH